MATTGGQMDFMLGGAHVVSFWIRYCKTLIQHWCNIWYCNVFFLYKLTLLPPDNGVLGRCLSVSLSGGGGGCPPCGHYPWCIASHCTGSPPDMGPSLETCSKLFIPAHCTGPPTPPQVLTSGSHWSTYGWTVRILLDCFLFHRLCLQF